MLEPDTTSSVLWLLRILKFTAAFPIEDDECGGVRPVRSRKYMIWHYVLATYHCMVTFYSGFRLIQSINMSNSIGDKVLHSFFFGCYMMAVTFKLNLQINQKGMAAFLNFCFIPKDRMLESIGIEGLNAGHLGGKQAEKVFRLTLKASGWFALIQSGIIALSITRAKCSPRYLLSLVDGCHDIKMFYVLLLLPYEYVLWIQAWAMFIFFPAVVVIWVLESGCWLSIAEWQQQKVVKGGGKVQDFRRFLHVYKQLEILNINFNDMLQNYFWPVEQTVMMSVVAVLYFILIKLHTVLPVFTYAFLTVTTVMAHGYTFYCYQKIAVGTERSEELLTRWKPWKEWNLIKRRVKACRKLVVKVGGCYSFNRCSNLLFTSLLVQILCNMLIAVE